MEKIKTIIIDDEKLSAEGIQSILMKTGLEVETVGVFYSSKQALEYLNHSEVDLVITDINMPEISGLELIAAMKEANSSASVIIVTGFGSLKYAQEAMGYGVKYFLQKPCSISDIKESVQKCLADIKKKKTNHLRQDKELIEHAILGKIGGKLKVSDSFSLLMYQDTYFNQMDTELRGLLDRADTLYTIGRIKDVIIYYLFSDGRNVSEEFLSSLCSEGSSPVVLRMTSQLHLAEIKSAFEAARKSLDYIFYFEKSLILTEDVQEDLQIYEILPIAVRRFEKEMKQNDFTKAKESLRNIVLNSQEAWLHPNELKNIMINLVKKLASLYELEHLADLFIEEIHQSRFASELTESMIHLIDQVEVKEESDLMGNKISTNLNLMIEKYYENSELSLRWISKNILYLNPEYLGKVYFKETGEKFTAKLQEVRLKKAAEFLEKGYKIYEVAKMTGYESNPNYFGRLFRQRFGVTPREYRRNND
jgi:two-component system response regulator YesN